jgi:hypothetical protein
MTWKLMKERCIVDLVSLKLIINIHLYLALLLMRGQGGLQGILSVLITLECSRVSCLTLLLCRKAIVLHPDLTLCLDDLISQ